VGSFEVDLCDSGQGPVAGSYEHCHEPFEFYKRGESDYISVYYLLKNDSNQLS